MHWTYYIVWCIFYFEKIYIDKYIALQGYQIIWKMGYDG